MCQYCSVLGSEDAEKFEVCNLHTLNALKLAFHIVRAFLHEMVDDSDAVDIRNIRELKAMQYKPAELTQVPVHLHRSR